MVGEEGKGKRIDYIRFLLAISLDNENDRLKRKWIISAFCIPLVKPYLCNAVDIDGNNLHFNYEEI